ncbi:hypothetical protein K0M31_003976 [Melipona bicolor]|uniref:Uncharacterized protein n=1 Tax=Melipona bicolor TaxID=60889 RepID=A0AA40KP01_9HYME|nr:hypothetical protein K0M31_003976 [Melipona bicolor]
MEETSTILTNTRHRIRETSKYRSTTRYCNKQILAIVLRARKFSGSKEHNERWSKSWLEQVCNVDHSAHSIYSFESRKIYEGLKSRKLRFEEMCDIWEN